MIFTERIPPPWWLRIASLGLIVLGAGLIIFGIASRHDVATAIEIGLGGVMAIGLGLATVDAFISLDIGAHGIFVAFGRLWRKHISVAEIEQWKVVDLAPARIGGIGLRWLPRTRALLYSGGPGIAVTNTQGLTVLVRSNRADDACEAIRSLVKSADD